MNVVFPISPIANAGIEQTKNNRLHIAILSGLKTITIKIIKKAMNIDWKGNIAPLANRTIKSAEMDQNMSTYGFIIFIELFLRWVIIFRSLFFKNVKIAIINGVDIILF